MSALQKYEETVNARNHALTLVPPKIQEVFNALPEDLKAMDELSLLEKFDPMPSDYWVRKQLWELVDLGLPIDTSLIHGNKITRQAFHSRVLTNQYRVAWMMTPMKTHQEDFEEMFKILHYKLLKYIAETPITSKNATSMMIMFEKLTDRTIGPVARNLNVRAHIHNTGASQNDTKTPEQLESELKQLKGAAPIIDVDAK